MKKGRFLWSAHRITEKQKAGKARNIKEKQLKNSRNTVSKAHVVHPSSQRDNFVKFSNPRNRSVFGGLFNFVQFFGHLSARRYDTGNTHRKTENHISFKAVKMKKAPLGGLSLSESALAGATINIKCSLPVFEKVLPIRVFLVKDFFLFGRQIMRIISKQIKHLFPVKAEKKFTNSVRCIEPPNFAGRFLFVEVFFIRFHLIRSVVIKTF